MLELYPAVRTGQTIRICANPKASAFGYYWSENQGSDGCAWTLALSRARRYEPNESIRISQRSLSRWHIFLCDGRDIYEELVEEPIEGCLS